MPRFTWTSKNPTGEAIRWMVEAASPNALMRHGFTILLGKHKTALEIRDFLSASSRRCRSPI